MVNSVKTSLGNLQATSETNLFTFFGLREFQIWANVSSHMLVTSHVTPPYLPSPTLLLWHMEPALLFHSLCIADVNIRIAVICDFKLSHLN